MPRARSGSPSPASMSCRPSCDAFLAAGAVRGAHRGAPRARRAGAGDPADAPPVRARLDPGGLRPDHGRPGPSGDDAFAARIVTTSPDVTVSTNLGAWVNRRSVFDRAEHADVFRPSASSRPSTGRSRRTASTSSSASPRTTCSSCWPRSASPGRCSARGCCRSARSTTRSSRAASMRSTTRATRTPASCWWRRRRASPWRPRAARTSRCRRR